MNKDVFIVGSAIRHTFAAASSASRFFLRISSMLRGCRTPEAPHPDFFFLISTGGGGGGASLPGGGGGGRSSGGGGGAVYSGGGGGAVYSGGGGGTSSEGGAGIMSPLVRWPFMMLKPAGGNEYKASSECMIP